MGAGWRRRKPLYVPLRRVPVEAARSAWTLARSWVPRRGDAERFAGVEGFCAFIGYPRSGHSLLGALLNAHPDAVIAHELNAMKYVAMGVSRDGLYRLLLDRAAWFARRGHTWGPYAYAVPGQWQGRCRRLRVIGDKKGMGTSRWLGDRPDRVGRLRRIVGVPLRFLHIVRNPFDNIATIARKHQSGVQGLAEAADLYFDLCDRATRVRAEFADDEWLEMRHEDFVADPSAGLRRMLRFLGLDEDEEYVRAAAGIVFAKPRRTREDAGWTYDLRRTVEERIGPYPFLGGYRFGE